MNPQNHGFKASVITPDQYSHGDGKLGDVAVIQDGQWDSWLPIAEDQNLGGGFEPEACVTFATTNAVETLIAQKYGSFSVLCKRFLAYASGTTQNGNDPQTVTETLRSKGDCLESDYPYTPDINSWEKFYAVPPQSIYVKALLFLSGYNYGHSWVTDTSQASLMAALNFSPLTAAVFAWYQDPQTGYYTMPPGTQYCHYVMIYGYVRNEYFKIWDSYAQESKKLAWDFPFIQVKRHTITKNSLQQALPFWQQILNQVKAILEGIQGTLGRLNGPSFGAQRSPQWEALSRAYRKEQPLCAFGMHKPTLLNPLNTHHVAVFHEHPELELVKSNWINVCRFHHLWHAHFGNWKSSNSAVKEDASAFTEKIKNRPT